MLQALQRGQCPLSQCGAFATYSQLHSSFASRRWAPLSVKPSARPGRPTPCYSLFGWAKRNRGSERQEEETASFEPEPEPELESEPESGAEPESEPEAESKGPAYAVEKSGVIYQEVVLLLVQMDLDAQLQRALNNEDYGQAQAVRARREKVDEGLLRLQNAKMAASGDVPDAQEDGTDLALECLRIQGDLQTAISNEEYGEAVRLRDLLQQKQARAEAAANKTTQDREMLQQQRTLQLGQRVVHRQHGYRGAICGWDGSCMEKSAWQETASVEALDQGRQQPFYHVLVDARDWASPWEPGITYVPQELLHAPQEPSTWVTEHGSDDFEHMFMMQLFLGQDERGDLIPVRQLRDKFLQQRRDIQPPPGTADA